MFGALLDRKAGGYFRIAPAGSGWVCRQLYFPDTNVLITRFLMQEGIGEVHDFMPISGAAPGAHRHRLVRRVVSVHGSLDFRLEAEPRFDYGRADHEVGLHEEGAVFDSEALRLALGSEVPLSATKRGVRGEFTLEPGERASFVLERVRDGDRPRAYGEAETEGLFEATVDYWRRWLSHSRYQGRWRDLVHRSALTLKLLTYAPTGAIVAAPTTSLPEHVGGGRNWDYRYTWIRDAAFTLYALLRLGFTEEAASFMEWLTERFSESSSQESGPLQIVYRVDGSPELPEQELGHLEGYRGSAPVRIGNQAARQLQLDIYGELVDSVYLYNKHAEPISHGAWSDLRGIVEWLCEHWDQADEGLWEVRGGRRRFTSSRLMCWVAVERAIRVARQRGLPADLVRWLAVRDEIYEQIMACAWRGERGAFVQHYETDHLDASVLLMPLVKFVAPTDPNWLSTLETIRRELVTDSLVHRYNTDDLPDGVEGEEGTFTMCSFWYVEALARAGRTREARLAFEKTLTYANHLGLYSEEVGLTGDLLGNFPQAFTHLSLISAAVNLDRQLGG